MLCVCVDSTQFVIVEILFIDICYFCHLFLLVPGSVTIPNTSSASYYLPLRIV